jgi:hypothetical protein
VSEQTTVDLTLFNVGMGKLVAALRIELPKVVKKEAGELIKTLVRITPPADPQKTRDSITNKVYTTFGGLSHEISAEQRGYLSNGVNWYAWDRDYLFGVQPEKDMTRAGLSEIKKLFLSAKNPASGTRQILDFQIPRKHQRVAIAQKVLTTVKQRQKLIDYLWNHVGRLKAGWLVATNLPGCKGIVTMTGANLPPKWVTRHAVGARGDAIDETSVKDAPSITIINRAAGVGNRKNNLDWLVRDAVKIRADAMSKNALLFMRGKKNLSDYIK